LHKTITIEELTRRANSPVILDEILTDLQPPSHFNEAEFSNYIPDPRFLSQSRTIEILRHFLKEVESKGNHKTSFLSMFSSKTRPKGSGIYLDGGFGVGKTHLLASCYHAFASEKKAYLSFQELMYLVGLQKLDGTFATFKDFDLLIIDEFELDDPANSRISTNLLGQLFDAGVHIITSSNTPPGALGDERFSDEDFRREIGEMAKKFRQVRVDGEDYRISHHLHQTEESTWYVGEQIEGYDDAINRLNKKLQDVININYKDLKNLLSSAHPMKIRTLLSSINAFVISGFSEFTHPHEALRFVYFIDKCYDDNIAIVVSSGVPLSAIFHHTIMNGGDTKKYRRTLSRLNEMTQITAEMLV
jgi:cell division protein ZapE